MDVILKAGKDQLVNGMSCSMTSPILVRDQRTQLTSVRLHHWHQVVTRRDNQEMDQSQHLVERATLVDYR